jgi:N-acyl-D-aspartate/D-glutamate deacylase
VQVFADQYAYEASSTSLRAALLPGGIEVPTAEQLSKADNVVTPAERSARQSLEATVRENIRRRGGATAIQIASYRPDPSLEGKHLAQIADLRTTSPERTALEMIASGGASIVSFNMSESDIEHIMQRPYTMTSSDGGLVPVGAGKPHPRNNGAFARKLAVYVRERHIIDLESAIRSMTSLPATVFGIKDRGVIREGAVADIAVFDLAKIRDRATYTDPHQLADGMSYVLVNGVVVIDNDTFTTAMPGKVLTR